MAPPYDVVATYNSLLSSDPDLTMPVAAIEALIQGLAPATTAAETMDLVTKLTKQLQDGVSNSVSLTAGTDLFQKYLESGGDLASSKAIILSNAKRAREFAVQHGRHIVQDGDRIFTIGGSRCVASLLLAAAKEGCRFSVTYVLPSSTAGPNERIEAQIRNLHAASIDVSTLSITSVASSIPQCTKVLVGAEAVVKNGGIINCEGTHAIAEPARRYGKPFLVVAETHKFTRLFPLSQAHLGDRRDSGPGADVDGDKGVADTTANESENQRKLSSAVDYTPPNLISAVITEGGIKTTGAVADIITKMWM